MKRKKNISFTGGVGSRCSKCKKVGHNMRTCGKGVKVSNAPLSRPHPSVPVEPDVLAGGDAGNVSDITQIDVSGMVESYNAVELETWWRLQNDSVGKMRKGLRKKWGKNLVWTEKSGEELVRLVEEIEGTPPDLSAEEWRKFFNNFGTAARENFLEHYQNGTPVTFNKPFSSIFTSHDYVNKLRSDNEAKPVLPDKFHIVFATDPSPRVRAEVAKKAGLSSHVIGMLVRDESMRVVAALTSNTEVSGEVLGYAEARIEATSGGMKSSGVEIFPNVTPGGAHYSLFVKRIRQGIASNPHISKGLAWKYLSDEEISHNLTIVSELYQNVQVRQEDLDKHYGVLKNRVEMLKHAAAIRNRKKRRRGITEREKLHLNAEVLNIHRSKRHTLMQIDLLLKRGRLPRSEMKKVIDDVVATPNTKVPARKKHYDYSLSAKLGEALQNSQTLTPEDLNQYARESYRADRSYILFGLVRNPRVPTHALQYLYETFHHNKGDSFGGNVNLYTEIKKQLKVRNES